MRYHHTSVRMAIIKDKRFQVLAKMWRKENPGPQLVEMQISIVIMKK